MEVDYATVEGLPREEMDALLSELVPGGESGGEGDAQGGGRVGQADSLVTISGGYRFLQGIYWAKPPKLGKQQLILLSMREAEAEEDVIKQTELLCTLVSKLLSVREGMEFRAAREAEIKDDDTGLTIEEIRDMVYGLMNLTPSAEGNA